MGLQPVGCRQPLQQGWQECSAACAWAISGVLITSTCSLLFIGGAGSALPAWATALCAAAAACTTHRAIATTKAKCRAEARLLSLQGRVALAHLAAVAALAAGCGLSNSIPGSALRVFNKGLVHPTQVFMVSIELMFVGQVLPPWAVLLVAEAYGLAMWSLFAGNAQKSAGPFHAHWQLLYFQLSTVLMPWCVYTGRAAAAWQWVRSCASPGTRGAAVAAPPLGGPSGNGCCSQVSTALSAGTSCASHKSKQLAASHCPYQYQSILGPPVLACLKIEGSVEPEDLSSAALQKLQHALCGAVHMYGQLEVMGVSVRAGCVLVCFETLPAQGLPAEGQRALLAAPTPTDGAQAHTLLLARQLLPRVLQSLKGAGVSTSGPAMQYVRLQIGVEFVRAIPDPQCEDIWQPEGWHIELEPQSMAVPKAVQPADELGQSTSWVNMLSLGLVRVSSSTPASQPDAVPHSGSSCLAAEAAGDAAARLQVQLWCPSAAVAAQLVVSGSHPGSHAPPSTLPQEQASSNESRHMQLWAVGSHAHLPVQVLHSSSQEELLLLQVEVQLPRCGLAAHHAPDGPLMALQPLSLQLWCGDTWLSTTHTLINLDTCQPAAGEGTPAAAAAAAAAAHGGWWGAGRALACQAATELQQLVEVVWDSSLPPPSGQQPATCLLLRDVNYWLQAVRQLAHTSQWCVCSGDAAVSSPAQQNGNNTAGAPALSGARCRTLAQALMQYTAADQPALHALVAQQLSAIVQPASRLPDVASLSPGAAAGTGRPTMSAAARRTQGGQRAAQLAAAVAAAARGYPCRHCERLYMARSETALRPARMSASFIMGVCSEVAVWVDPAAARAYPLVWMVGCWGLIHLVLAWTELQKHRLPRHASAAAYGIRTLACALVGLRVLGIMPVTHRLANMGAWAIMNFLFEAADQLQSAPMGPHLQLALSSFHALLPVVLSKGVLQVSWVQAVGGSVVATVVLPLMLAAYLRSTVMAHERMDGLVRSRGAAEFASHSHGSSSSSKPGSAVGQAGWSSQDAAKKHA